MPEIAEIQVMVQGLQKLQGAQVIDFHEDKRYQNRVFGDFREIVKSHIYAIRSFGKHVILDFNSGPFVSHSMLIRPGMTGCPIIEDGTTDALPSNRDQWVLYLTQFKTGKRLMLRLQDVRRLSRTWIEPYHADPLEFKAIHDFGPDVMSPEFNATFLGDKFVGRHTAVKPALMDQRICSGIGNYMAAEILFYAGIDPRRKCREITDPEVARIVELTRTITMKSIQEGGNSIKDFYTTDGKKGNYQNMLAVYAKAGQPCKMCGTPIKRIVQNNRSTFFCPTCQK